MTAARVYDVEWHPEVQEDFANKVFSGIVAKQLIEVAETALDDHVPPDGGSAAPYYWRRGITPQRRLQLHQNPDSEPDTGRNAWDYVLVYKLVPRMVRKRYLVLKLYHNTEVHSAALSVEFEELEIT